MLSQSPYILYSDGKGNIFEDTTLYVTGRSGWDALRCPKTNGLNYQRGVNYMSYPEEGELELMLRPGRCGYVKKVGQ
jgi:hypothetical protein